jgi:hypothetical protein
VQDSTPARAYRRALRPLEPVPAVEHGPVRTGRVPDGDILAWLHEQAGTTGQVPGRRKVIDKWALGSPRADRLRRIVRAEAARSAAAASAG